MKRLVGGEFLLDVSSIVLEENSELTNITDKEIISQLTNLKKFISNPSMIKPIWVKLYDGKLVVTRGSLSMIDADEFELDIILNGYTLRIYVKFTQMLNEDEDPIDDWYIANNDAKYLFTTNNFVTFKVANVKNIDGEILSQLKCGDVIIKEDASGEHAYIVSYRGETGIYLTYTDASVVETQSYDLVDDAWVYNSEDKTDILNPRLESIKDKDGHSRFIEGNLTLRSELEGSMTLKYGKWSLSGSHLLIVLACDVVANYVLSDGYYLTILDLPQWIVDKIVPIRDETIDTKGYYAYTNAWTMVSKTLTLQKRDGRIQIRNMTGNTTFPSSASSFRVVFDVNIDNE